MAEQEGVYDNFSIGGATNDIYSAGHYHPGLLRAEDYGIENSDEEPDLDQLEITQEKINRKATKAGVSGLDTVRQADHSWGTGTLANNSMKLKNNPKKGKRYSKHAEIVENESDSKKSVRVKKDKTLTMKDKQALLESVSGSLKSTHSKLNVSMSSGGSLMPSPEPGEPVPDKVPVPTTTSDNPVDAYIAYLEDEDEVAAKLLANKLEVSITRSDESDIVCFLDKISMAALWIKASRKWRKKALDERLKELNSAKRYIVLVSEAAIEEMSKAHVEDNQLLMEIELALESTRSVLPIFLGGEGTPFRGVNLNLLSDAPCFNKYCKGSPKELVKRLISRPCLKAETRLTKESELNDIVEAVEILVNGGFLEGPTGTSLTTDKQFKASRSVHPKSELEPASPKPTPTSPVMSPEPSLLDPTKIDWKHWELARSQVEIHSKIGEGEFGEVSKGFLHGEGANEGMKAHVAIKQLKKGSQADTQREFLREALFMVEVHHKNLVNIYGVCTMDKDLPILIVSELCDGGALKSFLPRNRNSGLVILDTVLQFMVDVCKGMEYLEEEELIHRDLAARNILVESDRMRCKIADLGLAVKFDTTKPFYQGDVTQPVPIRWTAPEAVRRGEFSNKSDVWSYGVVLYEMVTFGGDPYDGVSNKEVVEQVCDGNVRLPCPKTPRAPKGCPKECHDVMLKCWQHYPDDRPTFHQLLPEIEALAKA